MPIPPHKQSDPGYGGKSGFKTEKTSSMCEGHTSNSLRLSLSNHIGTHIDFPFHFDNEGKRLEDFPAEFWRFRNPVLVDVPSKPEETLKLSERLPELPNRTDLLLIRTGFQTRRSEEAYWNNNPGISPCSGGFLREKYTQLKAIGLDTISLTGFQNRELGREAHRAFLGPMGQLSPLLIIEDMDLQSWDKSIREIVVAPLLVEGADGAPVTVFGLTS